MDNVCVRPRFGQCLFCVYAASHRLHWNLHTTRCWLTIGGLISCTFSSRSRSIVWIPCVMKFPRPGVSFRGRLLRIWSRLFCGFHARYLYKTTRQCHIFVVYFPNVPSRRLTYNSKQLRLPRNVLHNFQHIICPQEWCAFGRLIFVNRTVAIRVPYSFIVCSVLRQEIP